ncbi:MAG: PIN domain-containing protein [Patescibacteria group bacterium]
MKFKVFLRPSIAIVFAFVGVYVARGATPPEIFAITGDYFLIVAFLAFATLGFILPDILELAGKAGIAALAHQLAELLPSPREVSRIAFRRRTPKYNKVENLIVVDTSVFIDGRILDIAKSGFINGKLLVLPSVVSEMQRLADSWEEIKRAKGRRGLDVLSGLQKMRSLKVDILKLEPKDKEVDDKLLAAARKHKAKLMTTDFNLNKVGKIRGVAVLNINELASALKAPVLPNERVSILISAKGKEEKQGVGYLSDGTMVVVEDGGSHKGRNVDVKIHKVIQTNAGKMIFARIAN